MGKCYLEAIILNWSDQVIPSIKQFQVIQHKFLLQPEEINEIYVDIKKDLRMNINVYNRPINKAHFQILEYD